MPKYLRTFLAMASAAFAFGALAADGPDDKAIYDRIVSLAGDWTGHMEDPLSGPQVNLRYETVSGGKAVIEHQAPSGSLPVVTVYFLAGGKLRATQYSPAGNQPAYKRGSETTDELLELAFEERWFHYVGPTEQGVTHLFLVRKAADAKPEEAPAPVPAPEPKPEAAPKPGKKP